jgi:hypothetical protein
MQQEIKVRELAEQFFDEEIKKIDDSERKEEVELEKETYIGVWMMGYRAGEARHPAGCEWVKCSDRLPGYKNSVKWRVSGSDVVRNATLEALLRDRNFYFKSWEWLDESPAPAAGREEEAVAFHEWAINNAWERGHREE